MLEVDKELLYFVLKLFHLVGLDCGMDDCKAFLHDL